MSRLKRVNDIAYFNRFIVRKEKRKRLVFEQILFRRWIITMQITRWQIRMMYVRIQSISVVSLFCWYTYSNFSQGHHHVIWGVRFYFVFNVFS